MDCTYHRDMDMTEQRGVGHRRHDLVTDLRVSIIHAQRSVEHVFGEDELHVFWLPWITDEGRQTRQWS
ncbi:hypothetical protein D3C71_2107360 [compost metagenome]